MPFLERLTSPGGARLRSTLRGQRALVHRPRLLPPRLLLDVVPNLGGSEVLAAEGMRVDLRGGGDGRVAQAFADGRQVHAFLQQEARVAVADRVEACALG